MSALFGHTRTTVKARHALIAPDGHVPSALPGFSKATPYFMISPAMGADLTQLLIRFEANGLAAFPADGIETVLYVENGKVEVQIGTKKKTLKAGGYAFAPAGMELKFTASAASTATLFRKFYEPLAGFGTPALIFGDANKVAGLPFLGNSKALLKTLLPADDLAYDLAMNIFTYQPGATLPFVETHIMEHGLLMLAGQGVYRLEEAYYPVTAGDVIWMAPYCPQWFVAMGDEPASYLYYKNVNRVE